jgi:hypothetical protein
MTTNIDEALVEASEKCSPECYNILLTYIEELEEEVEYLNVEIEAISSSPKKKRRRPDDEWN